MFNRLITLTVLSALVGCSSTIPPEVRSEASKVLSPSCMELLGNVAYQKRSRDILTMNPVFAISRGTDNGKSIVSCGASYSTAAISGLNASHALSICEQARENAMVERPKAVMQPCEIYMIGNDIVIGTDRAEAVRNEVSAKGQSSQQK